MEFLCGAQQNKKKCSIELLLGDDSTKHALGIVKKCYG
jgi:hypothetical protein